MHSRAIFFASMLLASTVAVGQEAAKQAENESGSKNVTIISTQSSADGKSNVSKEVVEECIVSLPRASELDALTEARSVYLKQINGKDDDNRYVKVYSATIEVNYLVRQKELIIITTNSVTGQEPVIKEVERTVPGKQIITSDSENGDLFAGHSPRKYYFSSAEAATRDARKRAEIWIKQNRSIVCP
jgi:predicted outer membrane protein